MLQSILKIYRDERPVECSNSSESFSSLKSHSLVFSWKKCSLSHSQLLPTSLAAETGARRSRKYLLSPSSLFALTFTTASFPPVFYYGVRCLCVVYLIRKVVRFFSLVRLATIVMLFVFLSNHYALGRYFVLSPLPSPPRFYFGDIIFFSYTRSVKNRK